jgi:hypothetical protein
MVFSLEHDIKVTKNHQNLLPTQSVLVAYTVLFIQNQYLQGKSQSEEILLRTFFLICIQER